MTSTVQSPLILEATTSSSAICFSELILVNGLDYIIERQSSSFVQIREAEKGEVNTNKPAKCLQGPKTICAFILTLIYLLCFASGYHRDHFLKDPATSQNQPHFYRVMARSQR